MAGPPTINPKNNPFAGWPSDKDTDDPLYQTEKPKKTTMMSNMKKNKSKRKKGK